MKVLSGKDGLNMRMDYEDIAKMGSALGSGGGLLWMIPLVWFTLYVT